MSVDIDMYSCMAPPFQVFAQSVKKKKRNWGLDHGQGDYRMLVLAGNGALGVNVIEQHECNSLFLENTRVVYIVH